MNIYYTDEPESDTVCYFVGSHCGDFHVSAKDGTLRVRRQGASATPKIYGDGNRRTDCVEFGGEFSHRW
jgi:hypothetical protein